MNKKISTLVASLLLTSAFSVYSVDAKPMLATPTQVETRAAAADVEDAVEFSALNVSWGTTTYDKLALPGFTNNVRLLAIPASTTPSTTHEVDGPNRFVMFNGNVASTYGYPSSLTSVGNFYWTLINGQLINNLGQDFTVAGVSEFFEIVPITKNGVATEFFAIATRANGGKIQYVKFKSTTAPGQDIFELTPGISTSDYTTEIAQAAVFCSLEAEYQAALDANGVNAEQGNGFFLSISSLIDEDATIVDSEVFNGLLTAQLPGSGVNWYQVKNANGKFLVFDTSAPITSDGVAKVGQFKLVDNVDTNKHLSFFQISKSDNGSEDVRVKVASDNVGTDVTRLYIANTRGTFAVSVAEESDPNLEAVNWAATTLSRDNFADLKQFVNGHYVKVEFVDAKDIDENNRYKLNGTLAVRYNATIGTDVADFVPTEDLYENAPEAQWSVYATDFATGIGLINRENPGSASVNIGRLRYTNTPGVYEVTNTGDANQNLKNGDKIRITVIEEHSKHDGYAVFNENDLRNETYYLGQVRQAEAEENDLNVYWAENHGTHQIGATVEEANASKWNLALAEKPMAKHNTEVDSVLIVTTLYNWNVEKNRIDSKQDTLVVLPYTFQNRSNNEFVKLNEDVKLEYYICDKDNKDNAVPSGETVRPAQRFALKMKADGTYNYIALGLNSYKGVDASSVVPVTTINANDGMKVYQENSTYYGTWKNMETFAGDANALMFVTKVTAPEYRKLVTTEALDTIKLYRADNEAQVVYEKRNDAAVVDGRTLSFLNIDNDAQFTEINPALYADTAYVNRGNNTRWQYLLGVNISHKEGYYCPEHGFGETEPCQHAEWVSYNEGRYLINMIDTANVYGANVNIHNNPYINETEEGNVCAKLSFVDAIHVLTDNVDPTKADKLYVINGAESRDKYTVIDLSTADFNVAKFAFKYTDSMTSDEFKIQTLYMPYTPEAYATGAAADPLKNTTENGYLRWVNGCIVVDDAYQKGDVFNMDENETRTPTANEAIEDATSAVSVIATEGGVIVKGAEGKNVIVSTILGKVIANEVVNSDNETIAAPAGIVVVSVDGESFKVAVK